MDDEEKVLNLLIEQQKEYTDEIYDKLTDELDKADRENNYLYGSRYSNNYAAIMNAHGDATWAEYKRLKESGATEEVLKKFSDEGIAHRKVLSSDFHAYALESGEYSTTKIEEAEEQIKERLEEENPQWISNPFITEGKYIKKALEGNEFDQVNLTLLERGRVGEIADSVAKARPEGESYGVLQHHYPEVSGYPLDSLGMTLAPEKPESLYMLTCNGKSCAEDISMGKGKEGLANTSVYFRPNAQWQGAYQGGTGIENVLYGRLYGKNTKSPELGLHYNILFPETGKTAAPSRNRGATPTSFEEQQRY